MLMVTADDLPDRGTGTNRTETLVLFGSVGGMKIGELTFTIWDAAVPALPVGGVLALGLLLMWRGRRAGAYAGAVSRRDEDYESAAHRPGCPSGEPRWTRQAELRTGG